MWRALLLVMAIVLPRAASADGTHWVEVRSANFTVLTDAGEKDGRRVAAQFERMRAVFHVLMPSARDDAAAPIKVLALRDKKSFRSLEPPEYLEKKQLDLAGYFLRGQNRNYILLRLDAEGEHPFATVYHEYTHYMLRKSEEWIPLWLNEGLAEFYQNTDLRDKDVRVGQPSAYDILYLRENRLLPLATLLKVDHASPYYHDEQKGSVFYAESWALTHYLEIADSQQATQRLHDYSKLMVQHMDSVAAAQQAFGDLKKLEAALQQYVQQSSFREFGLKNPPNFSETSFEVRPVPSPEADAVRADVLLEVRRTDDAEALLTAVLQADPRNAQAHETMGALRYRQKDIAGARKWYGEAVALDSKSYLAQYAFASMTLESGDQTRDDAVEKSLLAAIQLNPNFAPSYDALARFYASRHEKPAEAHQMNARAIQLEPEVLWYRLNASQVLAENRQFDDAVRVLKAAAHLAKTPDETESVNSRIYQIERYQAVVASAEVRQSGPLPAGQVEVVVNSGGPSLRQPVAGEEPAYPAAATGGRHTASGVLRAVKCSYPTVLTLTLDRPGKPVTLYTNNYFKVVFTTAPNYNPPGDLQPCTSIEGLKGKIEYADVDDKRVQGQIVSVELSK